jgi:uncharacterized integral membrane protein (TIGR00698 family)
MIKILKNEDWLAFAAGALIIVTAIFGLLIAPAKYGWSNLPGLTGILSDPANLISILVLLSVILVLGFLTLFLSNKKISGMIGSMVFLFVIALLSQILGGYKPFKNLGLEYVIFALILGIVIRNVIGLPKWLSENLHTEFYIKTGLVILGTSIIFNDIIKAGAYGLIQALVVVLAVWYFAFWLAKKFQIDEELSLMLSSAVSICGVSAAIATSGAIQGDSKKLSYVVSLVLITAIPMLIFMPMIALWLGLSPAVAGAWLGGTIDTTGAVVAAGSLLGDEALKFSTIVKFSQNVLLGFAAIAISIFWTLKKNPESKEQPKVSTMVIWERFPKFVLGFIVASLVYSFLISTETVAGTKDYLKAVQTTLFALAFVSTGLETNLSVLVKTGNGRPALVFLIAQLFNVIFTLVIAYLLFS